MHRILLGVFLVLSVVASTTSADFYVVAGGGNGIRTDHGSTVTRNTCYENTTHGITVEDDGASTVSGNTCYKNGDHGIETGNAYTITGNTCYRNTRGIGTGVASTVVGNTCYNNSLWGIFLLGSCFASQNTCVSNGTNMSICSNCTKGLNHAPSPP